MIQRECQLRLVPHSSTFSCSMPQPCQVRANTDCAVHKAHGNTLHARELRTTTGTARQHITKCGQSLSNHTLTFAIPHSEDSEVNLPILQICLVHEFARNTAKIQLILAKSRAA